MSDQANIGTADPTLTLSELMRVEPTSDAAVYVGQPETYGRLGIYGGHFLGQALSAAFQTVDEPKIAHSFHSYFLRAGDPTEPIEYVVTSLRSRPNGDTRSILARQHGEGVFQMTASFKLPEEGDEHQPMAPTLRPADDIIAERIALGIGPAPFPFTVADRIAVELVSEPFLEFIEGREPLLQAWTKSNDPGPLTVRDRQITIAYLSDGTLLFASVVPYGAPFQTRRVTSLDHAVWFHHDVDPAQWLIFDQRSTAAAGGRGMNHGEIYSADGILAASVAQESMLRRIA